MNIIIAIQTMWCERVSWSWPSDAPDKPSDAHHSERPSKNTAKNWTWCFVEIHAVEL